MYTWKKREGRLQLHGWMTHVSHDHHISTLRRRRRRSQELTEEEQVTGSGASALRSYLSFVQPRPGKQHGPVDNALDLMANRAANQVRRVYACGGFDAC